MSGNRRTLGIVAARAASRIVRERRREECSPGRDAAPRVALESAPATAGE